jgi:hypothetical protein
MHKNPLIFFVYPGPKGSEEPSQLAGELGAAKINLLPSSLSRSFSEAKWGWGK